MEWKRWYRRPAISLWNHLLPTRERKNSVTSPLFFNRGNYKIIHKFSLFSKSYNDLQYHFVVFYYIIHLKMSLFKSYTTFVLYYNIIHLVCTFALYHPCQISAPAIFVFHSTCRTPWRTTHRDEREASHSHEVIHYHC